MSRKTQINVWQRQTTPPTPLTTSAPSSTTTTSMQLRRILNIRHLPQRPYPPPTTSKMNKKDAEFPSQTNKWDNEAPKHSKCFKPHHRNLTDGHIKANSRTRCSTLDNLAIHNDHHCIVNQQRTGFPAVPLTGQSALFPCSFGRPMMPSGNMNWHHET